MKCYIIKEARTNIVHLNTAAITEAACIMQFAKHKFRDLKIIRQETAQVIFEEYQDEQGLMVVCFDLISEPQFDPELLEAFSILKKGPDINPSEF